MAHTSIEHEYITVLLLTWEEASFPSYKQSSSRKRQRTGMLVYMASD